MILKLSLNGLKGKLGNYLVLFTGLIISIAVFYMFLTLAINKEFIIQNSVINHIQLVFIVGLVLLSAITFFYLLYTNSFLLALRKKEFGIYEMIGVKKHQIKRVFLVETFLITGSSLILGIVLGILISQTVAWILMNQLNLEFVAFKPLYMPAILLTMLYFLGMAFITSRISNSKLAKASIIDLLKAEAQTDHVPNKQKSAKFQLFFGIVFLAAGYLSLYFMEILRFIGLFVAPIATTLGTYLLFVSLLPIIVKRWKKNKKLNLKGINAFTFSQLSFRLNDLKWFLATIAMLIALSAGAIAGGFAFKNDALLAVDENLLYDAVLYNPGAAEAKVLKTVPLIEQKQYHLKMDDEFIYFNQQELEAHPPLINDWIDYKIKRPGALPEILPVDESGYQILSDEWTQALETINPALAYLLPSRIVPSEAYGQIEQKEIAVVLARTEYFSKYVEQWGKLDELQAATYEKLPISFNPAEDAVSSKFSQFQSHYAFAGGTFFMGFFLGLAFLTMLTSVLMFKILSGALHDIGRYKNLQRLGVRPQLLSKSISKELFIVFLFPAVLGMLHVFVGMKMFAFTLVDPYYRLWLSVFIFLAIYTGYYFFTVYMYKKMVLPR
ncbi:FtsX-like permease family protein [Planococcus sp. YIM B11945]|uniref:FtsX-like permease family protein n=1 Tax=Planococcus sp. YIM B11945 TaxID=3435410 RepID=UPI003D7DBD9F